MEELTILEEHKKMVRERIESAITEDMIEWEEARKQLQFKGNK